ncbi:MAG: C39 family peptidase [Anaerolineaceae bacterium]
MNGDLTDRKRLIITILGVCLMLFFLVGAYELDWIKDGSETTQGTEAPAGLIQETEPLEAPAPKASISKNIPAITEPTRAAQALAPTQTATATTSTKTNEYPESFYITGVTGHSQVYALGCEASAAVDWANYFGVFFYEFDFQVGLPLSDNPDYGYVGNVNSVWGQIPPYAYGVHSDPLAELLVEYGLPAQSVKNYSLDQLKSKLSESKPVIAWVIGNMEYSQPVEYIDSQGRSVMVAPYEHVVILTGYDETSIRYMTNGKFYDVPTEVFMTSWGVLGNMAVIHE